MTNLPYRFREEAFRRYEPALLKVLENWPTPTWFSPDNIETFSNRFRDAMRSLYDHNWSFPRMNQFRDLYKESLIRVAIRGDRVLVGSKSAMHATQHADPNWVKSCNPEVQPMPDRQLHNPDPRTLDSLVYLHHVRVLTGPTTLTFDDPASFEVKALEYQTNYDVVISANLDEPKTFTIL